MAISPPSDLVLDVVRAADPGELQAAREKLSSTGVNREIQVASSASFSSMMNTLQTQAADPEVAPALKVHEKVEVPEVYRKFETSVLSTFVQNMMPKESEEIYGKGSAGEFWKSMMAEQVANQISERGGIGIAEQVYAAQLDKARGAIPNATADDSDRSMAVSMITDYERRTLLSPNDSNATRSTS